MHPVEQYLKQLQEIYQTGDGTSEESYYGALETLLNEVDDTCGITISAGIR